MKYESDKENCGSSGKGITRRGTPDIKIGCTQYQVIEERRRREKLNRHFQSLSALVPGLKKMDKASVLEEATTYLKDLQERVKKLEELSSRKPMESAVYISDSSIHSSTEKLPEIEARISDKNILIKIYCEDQEGAFVNILAQIAKLNLRVVNSSVMPFGTSILHVTIMAKMEDKYKVTVRDLTTNLLSSFV